MKPNVILCIDDEKIILDSLREQISARFGEEYEVEIGEGGEEGLEIIEEIEEDGKELALVISDHLMPGMKGDEFLIEVHNRYPETMKILLTGQASLESVGNAINKARIYRYIVKPWDENDLMLTCEKALNSFKQYLQLQEYNRLLQSLNASIQDISSEMQFTNVVNKVLNSTLESMDAKKGFLLMDRDGYLQLEGFSSRSDEETQEMHQRLKTNRAEVTTELLNRVREALQDDETRPFRMVAPITKKGKNLGYMFIENESRQHIFSENQKQVLQMLSSQAAISLDNAKLYERVERQKASLAETNKLIEQKNEDITASIRYAQRIQDAILPERNGLNTFNEESSIFFAPKDIVSGDFYWWLDKDEYFLVAAADCTGHGVPGGFMSMLCNTMLNEAVNVYGLTDPDAILEYISLQLRDTLNQDENSETKDGMDIALCVFDYDKSKLSFAGAHRPLVYIRDGNLTEIKGDKMSVAEPLSDDNPGQYNRYDLVLKPGDAIYLFSDGMVDQFGGPENKRLGRRALYEMFEAAASLPGSKQAEAIGALLKEWQGEYEQLDDQVLIVMQMT